MHNLQVRFVGTAVDVIEEAIEIAVELGEISETKYKHYMGNLYMEMPEREVELWLELLEGMMEDASEQEHRTLAKIRHGLIEVAEDHGIEINPDIKEEVQDGELVGTAGGKSDPAVESSSGDKSKADLSAVSR